MPRAGAGHRLGVHWPDRRVSFRCPARRDPRSRPMTGRRWLHVRGRTGLRSDVRTFVLIPGAGGSAWVWSRLTPLLAEAGHDAIAVDLPGDDESAGDRKSTRLNSSHANISYAVFCLKKKKI